MDKIESKIKVDRTSGPFAWVKSLQIQIGQYTLTNLMREDEINALIMLACFSLSLDQKRDPQTMAASDILQYTAIYLSTVVSYYCQYFILKNGVAITPELLAKINEKVTKANFPSLFEGFLLKRLSGDNTPFVLASVISAYSFGTDGDDKVISDFCQEFIPFKHNVESITELSEGMTVCGTTLVRLVVRKDHSEIWEAVYKGHKVAVKVEPIDLDKKELAKLLKGASFEKIIDHFKETDREYLNFIELKSFPYKLDYFRIDYLNSLNKKVKIMSWLDGPIDTIQIEDKKQFIQQVTEILYELHKLGFIYCNINPHHIMMKPISVGQTTKNRYRLIDYKNITKIKDPMPEHISSYKSLSLLSGTGFVTPYDDIESLLYVFNDLVTNKVIYTDERNELVIKSQLSSFISVVTRAIEEIRLIKQFDVLANNLDKPINVKEYVDELYLGSKTDSNRSNGFVSVIKKLINDFNEVANVNIEMTKINLARLNNIRIQFMGDPRFSEICRNQAKFNDITIKILNYMTNACEYEPEDDLIITQFLS